VSNNHDWFADVRARINRPNVDFDDVKAAMLANLDQLIDGLIPASSRGKTKGDELWCCNPTRADKLPDSFSINKTTGQWYDFSGKRGGNIVTLWRQVKGLADNTEAIFSIAKFLGVKERAHKPEVKAKKPKLGPIVETYDYTDLDGMVHYQVVRYEPKDFRQRRPNGNGGWIPNLDGVKRVIYRWPEVHKYPDASVFLCEGEKDADRVASLGHCATTIAGDGKWTADCVNSLAGRDVFILEDNDDAGREKSHVAATALHGHAASIRIVSLPGLPEKGDVSDWLNADAANAGKLADICIATAAWSPPEDESDTDEPQPKPGEDQQTRDANETIPDSDLPIIEIKDGQLSALATKAELMLIEAGVPVYQRGGTLVRPIIETVDASRGRKTKVAQLRQLDAVYMRDLMGRYAIWVKFDGRTKRMNLTNPPSETAATVMARAGDWSFKAIAGVISTPTMRPDGSLLMEQGYDEATGLLLVEPPRMPTIPDQPTKEHALAALKLLEGLLAGFPFVDEVAKACALSAIITPIVRGAFPVTTMHASRAPTAGSGKSFLWDIVAAIAIGQPMPVMSTGASEEETEKRLGAALLAGQPLISIDNISGELGGDALCQIIERPVVEIRVLGRSERVRIEARGTSMYATGNNFVVVGDVCRRVITVNLDPKIERPELRQFDFDPVERVLADRGKYIAAALTICRAYFVVGRPGRAPRLASFEGWSDTVRSALIWLGKADAVDSMENARAEDPERIELVEMIQAWERVIGRSSSNRSKLANVILIGTAMVKEDGSLIGQWEPKHPDLYAALEAVAFKSTGKRGQKPDPRMLGNWLRQFKGRIVDGKCFAMNPDPKNGSVWWVEDAVNARAAAA
jgi:putative DNA primase/helicase